MTEQFNKAKENIHLETILREDFDNVFSKLEIHYRELRTKNVGSISYYQFQAKLMAIYELKNKIYERYGWKVK